MKIQGRYELVSTAQQVWDTMLRPDVLRDCIPGCEDLEVVSENTYRATVTIKVGPIRATFKGRIELSDIDEPNSLLLSGVGQGGLAGNAKGTARVKIFLGELPNTSILEYDGEVAMGGKLAQLGSRLLEGVARKLADKFFGKLAEVVNGPAEGRRQSDGA